MSEAIREQLEKTEENSSGYLLFSKSNKKIILVYSFDTDNQKECDKLKKFADKKNLGLVEYKKRCNNHKYGSAEDICKIIQGDENYRYLLVSDREYTPLSSNFDLTRCPMTDEDLLHRSTLEKELNEHF